jgi:hypothetical protein
VVRRHGTVGERPAERQRAQAATDVDLAAVLLDQQPPGGVGEAQVPRIQGDLGPDRARAHADPAVVGADVHRPAGRAHQRRRPGRPGPGLRVVAEPDPEHALVGGADLDHQCASVRGGALEHHAAGVRRNHLGPGDRAEALLAGLAYRQLRGVGHENFARNQRRAVRHGLSLDRTSWRYFV